ncbi:MAG: hypothetical protein ACOY33_10435 [Pseudomonadota bacterium]
MRLLVLCSVALWPLAASAALPAGYQFSSVADAIPSMAAYKQQYADQQFSVLTATNNNGVLYGFRMTTAGMVRATNIKFGSNPLMTAVDSEHFVALSGADVTCFLGIFCNTEYPFGLRITDGQHAVTAFLNTPTNGTALPGSLPFVQYPGNFVDENRRGIVASTQLGLTTQHGVLFHGNSYTELLDVPWLVAINDLAEPVVLAYGGAASEGTCSVFGEDCPPVPDSCVPGDEDTHEHGNGHENGNGHHSHGNGNGYGHYKCDRHDVADGPAFVPGNSAILIRLFSNLTTVRYGLPASVNLDGVEHPVADVFPLAINDSRAVLRGDVLVNGTVYKKRLLSCVFNPAAMDANADGIADCIGGLLLVGDLEHSVRAGTVLGFSLNNAGMLAGNLGYTAASVGMPFLLDLNAAVPEAVLVANLADNAGSWEINALTDHNQTGKLVGYGFRDCAAKPQAFFLDPKTTAPAGGALRFGVGSFEFPALLAPGDVLDIAPSVSGGSGSYEFRVSVKTPADSGWTLLSDWAADAGSYDPGSYQGDVCLRVEARDAAAPTMQRSEIVRYRVTGDAAQIGSEENGDAVDLGISVGTTIAELEETGAGFWPVLLLLLLRRRRRA